MYSAFYVLTSYDSGKFSHVCQMIDNLSSLPAFFQRKDHNVRPNPVGRTVEDLSQLHIKLYIHLLHVFRVGQPKQNLKAHWSYNAVGVQRVWAKILARVSEEGADILTGRTLFLSSLPYLWPFTSPGSFSFFRWRHEEEKRCSPVIFSKSILVIGMFGKKLYSEERRSNRGIKLLHVWPCSADSCMHLYREPTVLAETLASRWSMRWDNHRPFPGNGGCTLNMFWRITSR